MSHPNSDLPWLHPHTAYLHVPFCGHHCGYCDFAVATGQDHLIELYLDALTLELSTLGQPRPIETLFIGGGTPTYLTVPQLGRMLEAISQWLPFRDFDDREYSIESTPESLDAEKVAILASFGVNRISIGVQSFQAEYLRALDRKHSVEQIPRAVEAVRKFVPALSFDLIFAAPSQTLEHWQRDLESALVYQPEHLSTYGLTYEKGTPLWKERERGTIRAADETRELAMYETAIEQLTAAGFEQYEISNFARPGKRSRHNERYWANEAYFGFGVGAARYEQYRRELNVRDTKLYIRRMLSGESPTFQSETLSPTERAFETIATQLRRMDGIRRTNFFQQTGYTLDDLVGPTLAQLVSHGLLNDDRQRVWLTHRGKCLADAVVTQLMTVRSHPS